MLNKFYLLDADRPEVQRALDHYARAHQAVNAAKKALSRLNARGFTFDRERGLGLTFRRVEDAHGIKGMSKLSLMELPPLSHHVTKLPPFEVPCYVGYPDKRTRAGQELEDELLNFNHLVLSWEWSLEEALGIYRGLSACDQSRSHYCAAFALADGRVIVKESVERSTPTGEGQLRSENDPVIPEWAIEITEAEFDVLKDLPRYTREHPEPASV